MGWPQKKRHDKGRVTINTLSDESAVVNCAPTEELSWNRQFPQTFDGYRKAGTLR